MEAKLLLLHVFMGSRSPVTSLVLHATYSTVCGVLLCHAKQNSQRGFDALWSLVSIMSRLNRKQLCHLWMSAYSPVCLTVVCVLLAPVFGRKSPAAWQSPLLWIWSYGKHGRGPWLMLTVARSVTKHGAKNSTCTVLLCVKGLNQIKRPLGWSQQADLPLPSGGTKLASSWASACASTWHLHCGSSRAHCANDWLQ